MSRDGLPASAETVIIGAGIVGNSLAYHLADQGRDDILLMDKGPLPDPGGSTGHASNFIMPLEHSSEMTELTFESIRQFDAEGVFENSGGLEVARTEERMAELRRRVQSANAFGTKADMLDPDGVKEKVPYINEEVIKGALYTPDAGTCDPLRFGAVMRERAQELGALTVSPNTLVEDIVIENEAVQAVQTDRGSVDVESELIIAAGVWSPELADMAGTKIPLSPAVHQMISVGPIEFFEGKDGEINYPVVRDMDTRMYERQHGNDLEIGSYEHRPILLDAEEIPAAEETPLSPTQLPFSEDAFEQSFEHALEIMPDILADETAGVRHAIDGLVSITPDGNPVVGPVRDVDKLWSCAAIWIRLAPGIARETARWMVHGWGATDIDLQGINIARFDGWGRSKRFVKDRGHEEYNRHYGIVHPEEQFEAGRPLKTSGFYERQQALDAEFHESAGLERPRWYESNQDLIDRYSDAIGPFERPNDWDARYWSPIILAEHMHLREQGGIIGDIGFSVYDVIGDDATAALDRLVVGRMDVDVGKTVYTPVLDSAAGFRGDITIARLGPDRYRILTGGASGGPIWQWFSRQLSNDRVEMVDLSSAYSTIGVWGPHARSTLEELVEEDLSNSAFPAFTAGALTIGEVEGWAVRISFAGELGWELYVPTEQGRRVWNAVTDAGARHDLRPVGTAVYANTSRMEKSYRLFGNELRHEYNPAEADLTFHGVKDADFIGKAAYETAIDSEPAAKLCTLTVDDHAPNGGPPRFMLGGEPVLDLEGDVLVDDEGRRSYVTSAATGPWVGDHLLMSYLPNEYADVGRQLQVHYFGQNYPASVEVVGSQPLYDPDNERIWG